MKCHSAQKKFSAYQDKELKGQEQEEISRHLLGCRSCREQYEKLDRVWQTLEQIEEIPPDPWFYRQLVRKIREPREKSLFPTLQPIFQLFRGPVFISIILIMGLAAGSYLGGILTRYGLFPFQNSAGNDSQAIFLTSLRVFDPAPPGTFAEGYLRMVSYKEIESR